MARIPSVADVRQVRPASIPQVTYPVEAFTAGARALQAGGDELYAAASRREEEDAAAEARKADADLQKRLREMRSGSPGDLDAGGNELDAGITSQPTPGWASKRGQGLLLSQGEIGSGIDSAYQEILDGLSDKARQKFEPIGMSRVNSEQDRLAGAATDARVLWQAETSKARASELEQSFIADGNEADRVALVDEHRRAALHGMGVTSLDAFADEATREDARKMVEVKVRAALTRAHGERINQLLVDDPNGYDAEHYFNEYKDEIDATKHDTISAAIENATFARDVAVEARDAVAKYGVSGAVKHAKSLADTKGQAFADAMLVRVNRVASEYKANISAAAASQKKEIVSQALNGATPRELIRAYPNWTGWAGSGLSAVTSAYENGQSLRSGAPLAMTSDAQSVVDGLNASMPKQLALYDLPTLEATLPKPVYDKWRVKIWAARAQFDVSQSENFNKVKENLRPTLTQKSALEILKRGGVEYTGEWNDKDPTPAEQAAQEQALNELAAHIILNLGANTEQTSHELLALVVRQTPASVSVPGIVFGTNKVPLSAEQKLNIVNNQTQLSFSAQEAAVYMKAFGRLDLTNRSVKAIHAQIIKNYKEAGVPLPKTHEKVPKLNDQQLMAFYVLGTEFSDQPDGGSKEDRKLYVSRLNNMQAKTLGMTIGPSPDETAEQEEAEQQARRDQKEQQKQAALVRVREQGEKAANAFKELGGSVAKQAGSEYLPEVKASLDQINDKGLTERQVKLVRYHQAVLYAGAALVDNNGDVTTVRTIGVSGPQEARGFTGDKSKIIYEIPSFVGGKVLSQQEAIKHAESVGWEKFPAFDIGTKEGKKAYEKFKKTFEIIRARDLKRARGDN